MGHTAGVAGLEPANAGVKVPCLTTWRHPIAGCPPHDAADLNRPVSAASGSFRLRTAIFQIARARRTCVRPPLGEERGRIVGLEPTTSRATIWRSTTELYPPCHSAPGGARTPDPRLRRPLLYPTELQAQTGNQAIRPAGLLADRYRVYQRSGDLSIPFLRFFQIVEHFTTPAAANGRSPLPPGTSARPPGAGSGCRSTSIPASAPPG